MSYEEVFESLLCTFERVTGMHLSVYFTSAVCLEVSLQLPLVGSSVGRVLTFAANSRRKLR